MRIGIGIGIELSRFASGTSIDAQAQAHYDRVIADGGAIPAGLLGCNNFFVAVKAVYSTSDITTAISAGYDAHYLGYKLGAGSGTTLGQAAQTLYSCCGASGDVTQATAASQPLLLVHDGTNNYYQGVGVASNSCSTPNAAANQITGDIDLIANANINTNIGTGSGLLIGKLALGSESYAMGVSNNKLRFYGKTGSTVLDFSSTSSVNSYYGYSKWYRITRVQSTGVISFYVGNDGTNWTLLDSTTQASGSLANGNQTLYIGSDSGGFWLMQGKIYRATISNSIGGAPVVDFNPASYSASTSQTQWTSTTGEVWTINTGTASTGYKGVLVDRTIVQGDGVDDTIETSGLNITLNTRYAAINPINISGGYMIYGKTGGNGDRHLWHQTAGNIQAYSSAGGSINFTSVLANRVQMLTTTFNTTSSYNLTNNTSQANGTLGSENFTTLQIFGNGASVFKNFNLRTLFETINVDNSTQNTAMYNAIRGFNGGAF